MYSNEVHKHLWRALSCVDLQFIRAESLHSNCGYILTECDRGHIPESAERATTAARSASACDPRGKALHHELKIHELAARHHPDRWRRVPQQSEAAPASSVATNALPSMSCVGTAGRMTRLSSGTLSSARVFISLRSKPKRHTADRSPNCTRTSPRLSRSARSSVSRIAKSFGPGNRTTSILGEHRARKIASRTAVLSAHSKDICRGCLLRLGGLNGDKLQPFLRKRRRFITVNTMLRAPYRAGAPVPPTPIPAIELSACCDLRW